MPESELFPARSVSFSQQLEVTVPSTGRCFLMLDSEWEYLKNKIRRIQQPKFLFQTIGSAALGVMGSALVAALTLPSTLVIAGVSSPVFCWGLTVVFLFGGALSLIFASNQNQSVVLTKEDVLEEMKRIEARFRAVDGNRSMGSVGLLAIHAAKYGAGDHWLDIVDKLTELVEDGKLRVKAGNEIAGDPVRHVEKELTIEYSYLGKRQVRTVREGEILELP